MKLTATLATTLTALVLTSLPASADIGWVSGNDGGLYSVDTVTWQASPVGVSSAKIQVLAATPQQVLGIDSAQLDRDHLVAVDTATGAVTGRGAFDEGLTATALTAAADGTVYASVTDFSQFGLYTVDPSDGDTQLAGQVHDGSGFAALAGACGGDLLGVDDGNQVLRIEPSSGLANIVGVVATQPDETVQALAFRHGDRSLLALLVGLDGERIVQVDLAEDTTTPTPYVQGQIGATARALAFDSPASCRYPRAVKAAYHPKKRAFTGRVTGEWKPCAVHQEVQVFKKVKGADKKLGATTTRKDGRFTLQARLKRGSAYAVARKSASPTGVCLAATSKPVR